VGKTKPLVLYRYIVEVLDEPDNTRTLAQREAEFQKDANIYFEAIEVDVELVAVEQYAEVSVTDVDEMAEA